MFGQTQAPLGIVKSQFKVMRSFNLYNLENKGQSDNKKFPIDIEWLSLDYSDNVLVCDSLGDLTLVDAKKKAIKGKATLNDCWLYSVNADTENNLLVVGSLNHKIHLVAFKPEEGKKLQELEKMTGHRGAVKCCQFLSKNYVISGSSDSFIGLWDVTQPHKYLAMLGGHMSDINSIDVCQKDKNIFLSGASDLSVKIWDIRLKNSEVGSFLGGESSITCVRFLPGFMETFAASSDDSKIR